MQAPEFEGITAWLNTKPLRMQALRGKVVLIDFWTYSCVNCTRTLPHLIETYGKYKPHGLVVVGVHSPEFEFEKGTENIRAAIRKHGITYPVANDAHMATWNAYSNRYWPAQYLIDADGMVRWTHFGEGGHEELERNIRTLLEQAGAKKLPPLKDEKPEREALGRLLITAETYCGSARNPGLGNGGVCTPHGCIYIDSAKKHPHGVIFLGGSWEQEEELLEHAPGKEGHILLRYRGREANLVMDAAKKTSVTVLIDGKHIPTAMAGADVKNGSITVDRPDLYRIVATKDYEEHELKLVTKGPVKCFAYTFG